MTRRVSLAEVADINPRTAAVLREGDGGRLVPFLPMSAVSEEGYACYDERRPVRELLKGYTYFERGDVLLAKITPCLQNGKAALLGNLPDQLGFGSTEFHVLRPGPHVDPRYLFHAVWNKAFRRAAASSFTGSAGQKRLPASFFERYRIPLPPPAEQRRIAAVLDKADAIRRKRRQSLRLLDEFLWSAFLEMFGDPVRNAEGWAVVRLGDLLLRPLRNGLSPAKGGPVTARVLTLTAVTGLRFEPSAVKTSQFAHPAQPDQIAGPGDFLICRGNGNVELMGRARFPRGVGPNTVFPDTMIAARVDVTRIAPAYLEAIWEMPAVRRALEGGSRTTSGIHKVNQQVLTAIRFPVPPIDVQKKWTTVAERVDRLRGRFSDAAASQLFDSLSQRAFGRNA